jgi:hypothetical protein
MLYIAAVLVKLLPCTTVFALWAPEDIGSCDVSDILLD